MTLKLYTTLKDKIGASRVEVEADTAAQAVARLRERYADIVNATLVDAQGIVRNHFTLTLNSQILDPHKLDGIPLKDGDLLHIFPPIAGGCDRSRGLSGTAALAAGDPFSPGSEARRPSGNPGHPGPSSPKP